MGQTLKTIARSLIQDTVTRPIERSVTVVAKGATLAVGLAAAIGIGFAIAYGGKPVYA